MLDIGLFGFFSTEVMEGRSPMAKEEVGKEIQAKSLELKNFLQNVKAVLQEWKFSVEETKEGTRIEVHAVALIRDKKA
jgi:hypothetical protein